MNFFKAKIHYILIGNIHKHKVKTQGFVKLGNVGIMLKLGGLVIWLLCASLSLMSEWFEIHNFKILF